MSMQYWPIWIEAITTTGTLIAALLLIRLQMSTLRESLEESGRASKYPAARMCIWKSTSPSGCSIHVLNASELPATGVRVTMTLSQAGERSACDFSSLFPPGQLEECKVEIDRADFEAVKVSMIFTDAFGTMWRRAPDSIERLGPAKTVQVPAVGSGSRRGLLARRRRKTDG